MQPLPELTGKCPCGANGYLSEPCYADEHAAVYCEDDCGGQSESYPMGEYNEGCIKAIEEWNAGDIFVAPAALDTKAPKQ